MNEIEKKRQYNGRIPNVERDSTTPLLFLCYGMNGKRIQNVLQDSQTPNLIPEAATLCHSDLDWKESNLLSLSERV